MVVALSGECFIRCGDLVADPPSDDTGVFVMAVRLYEEGYDVYMYDEDDVKSDGCCVVYDDLQEAIQARGVSRLAIYGHSHGGGSTHDLANRLVQNDDRIGEFSIEFTAYIDGIRQSVTDAETRLPPGTGYHINYYQTETRLLHGRAVPNSNYQCHVSEQACDGEPAGWGSDLRHGSIDNSMIVQDGIISRLKANLPLGITVTPGPTRTLESANDSVVAASLADLTENDDNLVRVWSFKNTPQSWEFYDPRPAFSSANSIAELVNGQIIWVSFKREQQFQGQTLFAGWNLIAWRE
jgi:hypothetical protein